MKDTGDMTNEREKDMKFTQMETFIPALFDKEKPTAKEFTLGNLEKFMTGSGSGD